MPDRRPPESLRTRIKITDVRQQSLSKSRFTIAVLISGSGTTLRNLISEREAGNLKVDIGLVISSKPDVGGIVFAKNASIPVKTFDHRHYSTAAALSDQIFPACRDALIDLVVMGGFLRKLNIPADFENRVINIHPSMIPAFCGKGMYGIRVHEAVIEKGSMLTGCTVHFVDNQFDHGPIIAQQTVRVNAGDSPQTLAARVFRAECELYPRVINTIASGTIRVVGEEVISVPLND